MFDDWVQPRPTDDEPQSLEERADRYVRRVEAFYRHAVTYVGVNALLVGINLFASPEVFWAVWPILGWGVKLGAHAIAVFGVPGRAGWRDRIRAGYLRRHGARPSPLAEKEQNDPSDELGRLRRRIEHLETIVTSADWELVFDTTPDGDTAEEQTAELAETVVHE